MPCRYIALQLAAAAVALLSAGPAAAQHNYRVDEAQEVWTGVQAGEVAGSWLDLGEVAGGDVKRDLIVGAPGWSSGRGRVYVLIAGAVRGGTVSLSQAEVVLTGSSAGDLFGTRTAAGYVLVPEGNGERDLVVSAPGAFGGRGALYVFRGGFRAGDSPTIAAASLEIRGTVPGDHLGIALATGDLNGDGYREIIAGSRSGVHIFNGGPRPVRVVRDLPADITILGEGIGSVLSAGDMNNDGTYDIAIGAPTARSGAGAVYVVLGRPGTGFTTATLRLPDNADAAMHGGLAGDALGSSLFHAPLDEDVYWDLAIGAPGARSGAGETHVLFGSRSLSPLPVPDVTLFGVTGQRAGAEIASRDVNRSGPRDLVIVAPGASGGAGLLYVYYGRRRSAWPREVDLASAANRTIEGAAADGGITAVAVYDITGEAADDIVVAAAGANGGAGAQSGKLYSMFSGRLAVSPTSLSISLQQGQTATGALSVLNTGGGLVQWSSRTNTTWVALATPTGESRPSAPAALNYTVTVGSLAPGTYTGSLSVASRTSDLNMVVTVPVQLTVTAAPSPPPPAAPTNPFGVPHPPDEGAPGGVETAVGANVAVLPMRDVLVTFQNVTRAGKTAVEVSRQSDDQTGATVQIGPWSYRITTTAQFSGTVTIGVAYAPSDFRWEAGVRLDGARETVRLDTVRHLVFGTVTRLPVTVAPADDRSVYWIAEDAHFRYYGARMESGWRITPGRLNDDSATDLLMYNSASGARRLAYNNGSGALSMGTIHEWSGGWDVSIANLNGDGIGDVFLYNRSTGIWYQCWITATGACTYRSGRWDPAWTVTALDFDGDGLTDLFLYNPDNGRWFRVMNAGGGTFQYFGGQWDGGWQVLTARLDLNNRSDLFLYNPRSGRWFQVLTNPDLSFTYLGGAWSPDWQLSVGDFNADGRQDFFLYNPVTGVWHQALTATGAFTYVSGRWDGGWQVHTADLNGDGRSDVFLYSAQSGVYFRVITGPSGAFAYSRGVWSPGWEITTADLTADGKDDLFLYNSAAGVSYVVVSR